jgi:hypothetical protein
MNKVRNDFKVYPYTATAYPDIEQWQVKTGKTDLYVTTKNRAEAERIAAALNIDPYYLERGNTQSDRAKGQAPRSADTYK